MESRWKASLIAFLLFLTRSGLSHQADDLDDSLPNCFSNHEVQNGIIDVKASVGRGADLLQGRMTDGYQLCAEQCCQDEQCDLALYRLEGLSDHGNNCYFIRCGEPAHCKIVPHDSFVFSFMASESSDGEDAPGRENSPRIEPTKGVESTASPSNASPSTKDLLATEKLPSTDAPITDEVSATKTNSEKIDTTEATPLHLSDTPPPATPSLPSDQHQTLSTVATDEVEDCEQNGCNGTGAVIFGVLGGIAILLLSIIVLVLTKRLYDFYKRKQFGNVDYLINGMYA